MMLRYVASLPALVLAAAVVAQDRDAPRTAPPTVPAPVAGARADAEPRTRNVAIVVHDGVELLDFAGPGEVFEASSRRDAPAGTPWFNVYTVAPGAGNVTSQRFVTIVPAYSIEDCPPPDILVIPGGRTNVLLQDDAFMRWVQSTTPDTEITMTVCTGAFVLAEIGLLDGLEATTHWGAVAGLRNRAPKAKVHDDRRYIDNGRIVTTAGVSAGIDGALHVVARLLGRIAADQTARGMEYRWTPEPAHAARYSQTNPQLDEVARGLQQAAVHGDRGEWPEAERLLAGLTRTHPDSADAWYRYGYSLHAQGRYHDAVPVHRRAAGFPKHRQRALYNAACAHARLDERDEAIATLGEAIEAGFGDRAWAENDADFAALRGDPRFAALLDKLD